MKEYTITANVKLTKIIRSEIDIEKIIDDGGGLLKGVLEGQRGFWGENNFDDVQINSYKVFELDKN